eukprot:6456441-Amphidinium_carterae.1
MEQPLFDFGLTVPMVVQPQRATPMLESTVSHGLTLLTINIRSLNEAGKLKFFTDQLLALVDFAFVQETRLPTSFENSQVGEYHIIASPALESAGAHGGLMVLVKADKQTTLLSHSLVCHRILSVTVRVMGRTFRLISAHAPIAEAPSEEHELFAVQLCAALQGVEKNETVLVGADLNARLQGLHSDFACVGECAASLCPMRAAFRHSCLRVLEAANLVASNTVVPHTSPMTWKHTSGSEHQIDYIFVHSSLHEAGRVTSVNTGAWSQFDCATTTDHCHVLSRIVITSTAHTRRARRSKKMLFVNDQHAADFAQVARSELPAWSDVQDPRLYVQGALRVLESAMRTTAPQRSVQRKPWITPATWDALFVLNRWRRLLAAWRRLDWPYAQGLFQELGSPDLGVQPVVVAIDAPIPALYEAAAVAHIKTLIKATRKSLRVDRKKWFAAACEDVSSGSGSSYTRELHAVIKKLCRTSNPRGHQLADKSGTVVSDVTKVKRLWFEHWQEHFRASVGVAHDITDRISMAKTSDVSSSFDRDPDWEPALQLDPGEVTAVLRRMPSRKATADRIPAAAFTLMAEQLGPPLCQLYNDCLRGGNVPLAYAGARVVPIYKRKGAAQQTKNYRPVSLLALESKLLAKLCLRKLESRLRYHKSQYGSGFHCGIEFPQLSVTQVAALAAARGAASCTLFVDVVAAFDSVAQPMVWGLDPVWDGTPEWLERDGRSAQFALSSMAAFLHSHPTILAQVGLPASIVELLRVWGSSTWIVTEDGQDDALQPTSGVPQGHNLAALIFDIFYSDIMVAIDRELVNAGIAIMLPCPSGRMLSIPVDAPVCHIGGVAFRDDFALALMDPDSKTLMKKTIQAAEIVASVHTSRHLKLNWAPGKTEVTLKLCGKSVKALMSGLRQVGAAAGLKQPAFMMADSQFLAISDAYSHLGRLHTQHLRVSKEVTHRLIKASASFKEKKRVLTSPQFPILTRLQLLRTYVVCHLLQNMAVAPTLPPKDYQRLRAAYVGFVRQVVGEKSNDHKRSSLTDEKLLEKFKVPSFLDLADRARLNFLRRLVIVDSTPLQALLAAVYSAGSFWTGALQSLKRLHACRLPALSALPEPAVDTIPAWLQFIVHHHSTWKAITAHIRSPDPAGSAKGLRQQSKQQPADLGSGNYGCLPPGSSADDAQILDEDADDSWVPGLPASSTATSMPPPLDAVFACSHCDFKGRSRAGLAMHARRKHGVHSDLATKVRSPLCPCCNLPFATRHRVLDHLRDSLRCRKYVSENVAPMTATEMEQVYQDNRGVDWSVSREHIPKPGPKPPGDRPVMNAVVPEFLDDAHRCATIPLLD